ncbi:uncharacterized protein JCM10292_002703 [Rhodotorula paludigena]|uniref:HIG1 domain-containing protein n=1 Tax=Rhodotorula paludigena TaxID=86838 RepID=A0AAV5GNM7_9BASI|nr:hypothetical protein Rhopal_003301-T1 [Rhodotorula paludigena]
MPLLGYIAGFASLGFGVRCYQLAIMKRNIFENLGGHALSTGAFAGLGYYAYHAEQTQRQLLADKKEQLLRMREKDDAIVASADGAHH